MIVYEPDEIALYPSMGMFKAGQELILLNKNHFNRTGLHKWLALIQLTPTARITRREVWIGDEKVERG